MLVLPHQTLHYTILIPYSAKLWRGKSLANLAKRSSFANILPRFTIVTNGSYCKFANGFLAKALKQSICQSLPANILRYTVIYIHRNHNHKWHYELSGYNYYINTSHNIHWSWWPGPVVQFGLLPTALIEYLTVAQGYTVHGKILVRKKLTNCELFTKIFPNIHRYTENIFDIYTDCSLFVKFFLTNSFYPFGSKFPRIRYPIHTNFQEM